MTSKPLPEGKLATRSDQPWEWEEDERRITYAKRWAVRRSGEIVAAMDLGADMSDPDFANRIDTVWAELSNRLTRKDLLRVFWDSLLPATREHANSIRASYDAEVDALLGEPQWRETERS